MSDLDAFYAGFSKALTDRDPLARPSGLDDVGQRRFAIYRNNVHRGLSDALAAAYPTVTKLVGEGFFAGLAQEFVVAEGVRPGSLALYGAGFADFLAKHDVAKRLPYLADIARLERARLISLNAADAEPLGAQHLAGKEDQLAFMRFAAHPACQMIASDHPIFAIWQVQNPIDDVAGERAKIIQRAEAVLITRPLMEVAIGYLTPAQTIFAKALLVEKLDLEAACERAAAVDADFDVTRSFADLLIAGAFVAPTDVTKGNAHAFE